jgi:hypothetical protein
MKWEDHRSWVLGSIAGALIAIGAAVFSVVYAAYYNRTHHIAEWGTIGASLTTPVPLWFVFLLSVGALWVAWRAYTLWHHQRFVEARLRLPCQSFTRRGPATLIGAGQAHSARMTQFI